MTRSFRASMLVVALLPVVATPQSRSDADLRKQVEDLRAEVKTLRTELDRVSATLRDMTTPKTPVYDIGGAPSMGEANAKLVLIEFSDYQCPFCREYFSTTYRQVIADYVKTGKLRYVVRDFPGESIHPNALQAAVASRCAGEQNKFWEMHDNLFTNQKNLGTTGITESAAAAGLDIAGFNSCVEHNKYTEAIRKDEDEIARMGAKGTPAFFLGTPDPANPSKIKLVRAIVGAQPFSSFQQNIDSLIQK